MIVTVLVKKQTSKGIEYVGKGFHDFDLEAEGIVSDEQVRVYVNEKGQIEKVDVVLPVIVPAEKEGEDDREEDKLQMQVNTLTGVLSQIELEARETMKTDETKFSEGILAMVKKFRDLISGKLRINAQA